MQSESVRILLHSWRNSFSLSILHHSEVSINVESVILVCCSSIPPCSETVVECSKLNADPNSTKPDYQCCQVESCQSLVHVHKTKVLKWSRLWNSSFYSFMFCGPYHMLIYHTLYWNPQLPIPAMYYTRLSGTKTLFCDLSNKLNSSVAQLLWGWLCWQCVLSIITLLYVDSSVDYL